MGGRSPALHIAGPAIPCAHLCSAASQPIADMPGTWVGQRVFHLFTDSSRCTAGKRFASSGLVQDRHRSTRCAQRCVIDHKRQQLLFVAKKGRQMLSLAATGAQEGAAETPFNLKALLFDCDGVIVLSEDLHRVAYNAAFEHFEVRCNGEGSFAEWSVEFYDKLQNTVGGGKPKMRWYFGNHGWPTSTVLPGIPQSDEEQALLIDTLQDWKSAKYREIVSSGEVPPREGVLELMDEAREKGLLVGVCSAATKGSAVAVVQSLLGPQRFESLDVFLAGDDVAKLKPDPCIYLTAAEKLGVEPSQCLVVEDSIVGLKAAQAAGMRCVITYTGSTKDQDFSGAYRILEGLGGEHATLEALSAGGAVLDDRALALAS